MLNVFRENLRHLKWVLWLVAASMVFYLGYYFIDSDVTTPTEGWAARVGDQVVSTDEFLRAARRQDDFYRRLLGTQYEQLKPQIRLGEQVIQELIDRRIAVEEATRLGLEATKVEVARRITDDVNFRDASGNFIGKERYLQIVRSYWGDERSYEQAVAEDITVAKWERLISEPATVDDEEVERAYRTRNERAAIDYVFVANASRPFSSTVSPSEAETWYRTHAEDYRRGEARRLLVLVLDRDSRLDSVQVADTDIDAYYRENTAQFQRPEGGATPLAEVRDSIRRLLQVRRADEAVAADAERLRTSVSTKEQLEEAAKERGAALEDWVVVRDEPAPRFGASPEFLEAAFAAPPGTIAAPARVARGVALAAVVEALPPAVPPLEEILVQVQTDILNERGKAAALAAARGALAAAGDLPGAAKRLGSEVRPSGDLAPGQSLPGAGRSDALSSAIFGAGAAVGDQGVVDAEGGAIAYRLTRLDRFDPQQFREAAPALREELLRQRRELLLQSVLNRLRTRYTVEWNREVVERANG